METLNWPTPYAEVNLVLHELLTNVRSVLGEQFVGMYLYGSLASGDFDPERSDIDFVVVTRGNLPEERVAQLQAMHARLYADGPKWARKLEGAYVPQSEMRRFQPNSPPCPFLNEGRFYLASQGSDWIIQRHVLREQGVIVAGPEIRGMIDPVRQDDLRRAVSALLHEWWEPILKDPTFIRGDEYQAYAVLTMCRSLYTMEHGMIASKRTSAAWAKRNLDAQWEDLISWALAWKRGVPSDRKLPTLAFVKFTLESSRQFEPTAADAQEPWSEGDRDRMQSLSGSSPYPEVNFVLNELLTNVRLILGDHLTGMYLHGSLASGDFDRESDVDYIVVTDEAISAEQFSALDTMHQRIATMDVWCATQLEGSYLPRGALRQYDPVRAQHVHIDRGRAERLHRMHLDDPLISRAWWGGWVILRHTLRERGITLAGPAPHTLIDPVSSDGLREASAALLKGWTKGILDDPAQIENRGYQAYTVLTLCRILYTLENGAVVSKRAAEEWARETLEERWVHLLERAWAGRLNPGQKANPEDVNRTLDLISYALERSKQFEIEGSQS